MQMILLKDKGELLMYAEEIINSSLWIGKNMLSIETDTKVGNLYVECKKVKPKFSVLTLLVVMKPTNQLYQYLFLY